MQQMQIEYFFPLTEQISLDLDFTLTEKFIADKRAERLKNSVTSGFALVGSTGVSWATVTNNIGAPSFTIDVDQTPITISSKNKPNFIKRYMYKALGMKWKAK